MNMEKALWILNLMSLTGAWLNSSLHRRQLQACYVLWTVANVGWVAAFYYRGMWPETFLFAGYLGFSLRGLRKGF